MEEGWTLARAAERLVRKIKHLPTKRKLGPAQIAGRLGLAASTVHKVLVREGINRLDHVDRATGEPCPTNRPPASRVPNLCGQSI